VRSGGALDVSGFAICDEAFHPATGLDPDLALRRCQEHHNTGVPTTVAGWCLTADAPVATNESRNVGDVPTTKRGQRDDCHFTARGGVHRKSDTVQPVDRGNIKDASRVHHYLGG
jgi:hypothetical protein